MLPALLLGSCEKYLDVNTNPNAATRPPLDGLLLSTTQNTGMNVYRVSDITSYYVQYLANTSVGGATDTYEPIDASTTWTYLYDNMTNIYDLDKFAQEVGATKYQGAAKIMMAMNLQLVHNLWGSAPYSDAFTGTVLTPKYDEAEAIFDTCLSLLDQGISLMSSTAPTIELKAGSDVIHGGDIAAWIRTAHALKARLLNQLSKTNEYDPAAIFAELAAAYKSTLQDAAIRTFDIRNPWNQAAVNNAALDLDAWLSDNYVDAMDATTYGVFDPRLPLTASLTQFGDYRGTPNGGDRIGPGAGTKKEESYVDLNGYYSSENSPLYIITYEETKLIEAEVAFRTSDLQRAYTSYLEGIRANMTKMGVSAAERDTYLAHPSVAVGATNLKLEHIFKEKYKALFLMPVTWDDARRFNYAYPDFELPENVVTTTFVRRLVYPTSAEVSRNSANVPMVNDVTERLWWDQ